MTSPPPGHGHIQPQLELLQSLAGVAEQNLTLLLPREEAWQPTDFLPDLAAPDWVERVAHFRERARQLADEVLVVLVGDMVTEEALPNYAMSLNLIVGDQEGTDPGPWARWLRGWVAEENRHGDLLNAFLRLTGRVDMRAIELTIQHLIARGFNPRSFPDPYGGLIYTSFQERATKISHANVGRLAVKAGDENLARICQKIAGDESRHETFYTKIMGAVMAADPGRAVVIFRRLLRRIIAMPGMLMDDGRGRRVYDDFAAVAQRLGVYTSHDYAQIVRHLVKTWGIADLQLTGDAAAAQEYLCQHADRLDIMAETITARARRHPPAPFGWIYDRRA